MKKVFISSLVLLILVLIFLGVYNFAFKKNVPETVQNTTESTSSVSASVGSAASASSQKIIAVSVQGVLAATFDKKNNLILSYASSDGSAWKSAPDGKGLQQISGAKVAGLTNVSWSADLSKTLMTTNVGGTNTFYEYDSVTQKLTTLKNGLDSSIWDNMGAKIFYKYFDSTAKTRTLNIANPDGTGWQKLADLTSRNISMKQIPMTSTLSFWNSPTASEQTNLQTVGITGGAPQTIFTGKYGADYLWSPNGSMALVSALASQGSNKMTLGIVKTDGTYNDLNIPTLASKCVWSADNKTIYYALPGGIPDAVVMPDDYTNNKFMTNDTFWKMDVTTGQRDRILDPADSAGTYDSTNLFISPSEDALYFINKIDKKLYRLSLQ